MSHYIEVGSVHLMIRRACDRAGGQVEWADEVGISKNHINAILRTDTIPGPKVLRVLGLKRANVFVATGKE